MSNSNYNSRIKNFYRMTIPERINALEQNGLISEKDATSLRLGTHTLKLKGADKIIENVVGVFGLPLGYAVNFLINDKDYVVPLVVEEASIVAGLSAAARIISLSDGFSATGAPPILIGQVQVIHLNDIERSRTKLIAHKQKIVDLANSLEPNLLARGGGAFDIEILSHRGPETQEEMLVVHLLVDTRDAMEANLINRMCEGIASLIEDLSGGKALLKILSNLTDRAIATAKVTIQIEHLTSEGYKGEDVRDRIILANDLASVDPYRAATHNKGIMNGVDAVAIATGNDWRAIEAAVHAWAARDGQYRAITSWRKSEKGELIGEIKIPLNIGTVGSGISNNRSVQINQRLLGSPDSIELTEIIASVGLAQNFAALRALATAGIQANHMTLHARSVVAGAGIPANLFDKVVTKLIASGEIKDWKAIEIFSSLSKDKKVIALPHGRATGKVILLGEHSVVFGQEAIAFPIDLIANTWIHEHKEGINIQLPSWKEPLEVNENTSNPILKTTHSLIESLGLGTKSFLIKVDSEIPEGMGLGSSAATAVSVLRALNTYFELGLSDTEINQHALLIEKTAHGTPSGIDNTMATYGFPMKYKRRDLEPDFQKLSIKTEIPLVIGLTEHKSKTIDAVRKVRLLYESNPKLYEDIFNQIGKLVTAGICAIKEGNLSELGQLMNINHGYLNSLQLSTPDIENLVNIARENGALGAKMTGGGGGGSVIALCPQNEQQVVESITQEGYHALLIGTPQT